MPSEVDEITIVRDPATDRPSDGDVRFRVGAETTTFSITYRAEVRDFIALRQMLRRIGPLGRFAGIAVFIAGPLLLLGVFLLAYPWIGNSHPSGFAAYTDIAFYRGAFKAIHIHRRPVGIGLALYSFVYMSYSAAFLWAVWRNASTGETVTVSLSSSGVESVVGETISCTKWRDIAQIIERGPYLFLLPHRHAGYVVPRRAAASDAEFASWTAYASARIQSHIRR